MTRRDQRKGMSFVLPGAFRGIGKSPSASVVPDANNDEETRRFIQIIDRFRALAALATSIEQRVAGGGTGLTSESDQREPGGVAEANGPGSADPCSGSDPSSGEKT